MQPASQPTDPSPLRNALLAYIHVFLSKNAIFGNEDPFRHKTQ